MSDFYWVADYGLSEDSEPRVLKAQFGDGYSQRAADGLNSNMRKWRVRVAANPAVIDTLRDFLKAKGGHLSFTWTVPATTEEVRVVCTKWNRLYDSYGTHTMSCDFEEVPA